VLATQEVFDAFLGTPESHRALYHGHTYTGNPLSAAVALANLDVFEEEGVIAGLEPKIALLERRLEELVRPLPHVGDVRQAGLMVGIELVADRESKRPFPLARQTGALVARLAREHAVIMRPLGDVVVLMPRSEEHTSELQSQSNLV